MINNKFFTLLFNIDAIYLHKCKYLLTVMLHDETLVIKFALFSFILFMIVIYISLLNIKQINDA